MTQSQPVHTQFPEDFMSRPVLRRTRAAFTLMEVMLVLVILVVLGSLAVQMFAGQQRSANLRAAQVQVDTIDQALDAYHLAMNNYPADISESGGLFVSQGDAWDGPYLKHAVPNDPWGTPYNYDPSGQTYHQGNRPDVWSNGPPNENKPIFNH
jgi:general secretion pathway protein G